MASARSELKVYWIEVEAEGLMPLTFAVPTFQEIHLVPGDDQSPLKEVRLTGWTTTNWLIGGEFDAKTLKFSQAQLWADSYIVGEWTLGQDGAEIASFGRGENSDSEETWFEIYRRE